MSGQYVETNTRSFVVGASAIAPYTRVKSNAGLLEAAGLTDKELGTMVLRAEASTHGAVRLRTANGTCPMIASKAIALGDPVFTAASGKISDVQGVGAHYIGVALEAASGDGAVIEVLRDAGQENTLKAGSYTAVAGDDTAGLTDIATGLSSIISFGIQILRSGVPIASDQVYSNPSGGTLRVADGASTYDVTAGDVIKWWAVGGI